MRGNTASAVDFNLGVDMAAISKALGALIGGAVGVLFSILAVHGIGDGTSVFGISQDVVLSILTPVVAFIATFLAPKNAPPV